MNRVERLVISLVVVALAGTLSLRQPQSASAHPLGNFTINHYSRLELGTSGIQVYRVLDMAEIPAFQERQQIDKDRDGVISAAENASYASVKAEELRSNISLRLNGKPVKLTLLTHDMTFPPGQADLMLLRLTATYSAELPEGWQTGSVMV